MFYSQSRLAPGGAWETAGDEHPVTKDGSNARKRAARELAAAEQITYTEALRRTGQRTSPAGQEGMAAAGTGRVTTRVTQPVATLTTDVVLIGHTGPVSFVAFGPDGRTVASGGDVTARLWDLATRQATTVLTSEAEVISAALSPDVGTLAVAGADGTITLWAFATGQITALTGCDGQLEARDLQPRRPHPGQQRVAAAGPSHGSTQEGGATTVRLWESGHRAARHAAVPAALLRRQGAGVPPQRAHPGQQPGAWTGHSELLDLDTGQVTTLAGRLRTASRRRRSARTAEPWPPAAATPPSGCGTRPPGRPPPS